MIRAFRKLNYEDWTIPLWVNVSGQWGDCVSVYCTKEVYDKHENSPVFVNMVTTYLE